MTVDVKPIHVICPICNKETKIDIPIFVVNYAKDGMVKIQIPQGSCCQEHSFMAFVDKKFVVRGYQNADIEFNIKVKEKTAAQKKTEGLKDYSITDMIDMIGPDICALILRSILIGIPILLLDIFDLYDRVDKTVKLLRDMSSEELTIMTEKISKDDTEDKKSYHPDDLIIVPLYKAIMRSPFLEGVNTRFESNLLREATKLPDRTSQIVFLRKELVKINRIIEEFIKLLKNTDKLYEDDIPIYIKDKFNYNLDAKNIDVIKQIIAFKDKKLAQKIIKRRFSPIRTESF